MGSTKSPLSKMFISYKNTKYVTWLGREDLTRNQLTIVGFEYEMDPLDKKCGQLLKRRGKKIDCPLNFQKGIQCCWHNCILILCTDRLLLNTYISYEVILYFFTMWNYQIKPTNLPITSSSRHLPLWQHSSYTFLPKLNWMVVNYYSIWPCYITDLENQTYSFV